MADRVLMISWGMTVRGREERALEVFNETVGYHGRNQQEGRIESFDVVLLTPNATLNGYMTLHGTSEQLNAIRNDTEFRRLMADAALIVDDLRVADGYAEDGVADQMAIFTEAVAKVPQMA